MHTFISCHLHCAWSTKERRRHITPDLQKRLWPYLGGIARANKMTAIEIGGVADHVHALISLPTTLSISKAIRQNGFMKHFPNTMHLNGRRVMARSASAFQELKQQLITSSDKPNIIANVVLKKNSLDF
jgi:REP element-mobilizing transposase RayT